MSKRPFTPDAFAIGLLMLGAVLLLFPGMRVAGVVALASVVLYWLLMGLFDLFRR